MIKSNYAYCFVITVLYCLTTNIFSSPLRQVRDVCDGGSYLNYELNKEYVYNYQTTAKLWINDVSEEAESELELKLTVLLLRTSQCQYQLSFSNAQLSGESTRDNANAQNAIQKNPVVFYTDANGAISENVKFTGEEPVWVQNIKRGIISSFQVQFSQDRSNLRSANPLLADAGDKSSVVYETDLLGKCRTTYTVKQNGDKYKIIKKKSLHRCSLEPSFAVPNPTQGVKYRSIPEYYQGRLFYDQHRCTIDIENGIIKELDCEQESTFKQGSRGDNGVQVISKQSLEFAESRAPTVNQVALDRRAPSSIIIEYHDHNDALDFNADKYFSDVCNSVPKNGLEKDDAQEFVKLVRLVRSKKSKAEILQLLGQASGKCKLAGVTVAQAAVFGATEASVQTVLDLLDKGLFDDTVLITEYPALTPLARFYKPTDSLVNTLKTYLAGKKADFPFLKKLYLVYSTYIKKYCQLNDCSSNIADWTSVLTANLGTNCADSSNPNLVVASLKAIGNIGQLSNTDVLVQCASNKKNHLEVRVSAVEAFRRFDCDKVGDLDLFYNLLTDSTEDAEVRIKAFLALTRCLNTPKFQKFAEEKYADFLLSENDLQVVTFIIDYAKEHGVTALLNPVLANPNIRDKMRLQFKEFSWHQFAYRYSVTRDAAIEFQGNVIYTAKSFVPRSIQFNVTIHAFGWSVNNIDITLRLQGLDELLKAVFVEKLSGQQLVERIIGNSEQLLQILQAFADKLKYAAEAPYGSLSVKLYGSEIFFSQIDSFEKIQKLGGFFRDLKASLLYKATERLRNLIVFENHIHKGLINGFEFQPATAISFTSYLSRGGERNVKDSGIDFNFKFFHSASFAVTKAWTVRINCQNQLALTKRAVGKSRIKVNVDGNRNNGSFVYNVQLAPEQELSLFELEGKYFKLGKAGESEVTQFKIDRYTGGRCTSQAFHDNVGLDLCFSVDRPAFRRLRDVIRGLNPQVDEDDDEDEDNDDDDDDDGDDDKPKDINEDRPKITLAGPYRYALTLKNPEGVNKVTLNAKWSKDANGKNVEANLETVDSKNVKRSLNLVYKRYRIITSLTYNRGFSLELKVPQTNDLRLNITGAINYRRKELLDVQFEINNKILTPVLAKLAFSRIKNVENIAATYKLESIFDAENMGRYFHLNWDFVPNGRSIESNFFIERLTEGQLLKLINAQLTLNRLEDTSDPTVSDVDYDVNFDAATITGKTLYVKGRFGYGILQSNIDLTGQYNSPTYTSPGPVHFKAGHAYSATSASHVELELTIPLIGISHGGKLEFQFSETVRAVTLYVKTPKTGDTPYKIYYSRENDVDEETGEESKKISIGFNNFNYDLSERQSFLANTLKKVDGDNVVRAVNIEFESSFDKSNYRRDITFVITKNGNTLNSLHVYAFGNRQLLKDSTDEFPENSYGAGFEVNALEIEGSFKGTVKIASSVSKKSHNYDLNIHTTGAVTTMLSISDVEVSSDYNAGKQDFSVSIVKSGGEFKSLAITGKGAVRSNGDKKEFDINYSKTLNDGTVKSGKGVISYTWTNFKNFEASGSVAGSFELQASLANARTETSGNHLVKLRTVYTDQPNPEERNFELSVKKNVVGVTKYNVGLKAQNTQPGQAGNKAAAKYIIDVNVELQSVAIEGKNTPISYVGSAQYFSKRFNIDWDSKGTAGVNPQTRLLSATRKINAKFPAVLSAPGSIVSLNYDASLEAALDGSSVKISEVLDTDSKIGGPFRYAKSTYTHTFSLSSPKIIDAALDIEYKLKAAPETLKNFELTVGVEPCGATCFNTNVGLTHDFREQTTKCSGSAKGNFEGSLSEELHIDASVNLKCNDKVVTDTKASYCKIPQQPAEGVKNKRILEISSTSDNYEPKKIKLSFGPFNRNKGSAEFAVQVGANGLVAETFEYTRELDAATGKLLTANYKATATFGPIKKECTLAIAKGQDYSNQLSCSSTTLSGPTPLKYGYRILVPKLAERPFGQRSLELEVLLPVGRQLRLDYALFFATPIDGTDDDDDPNDEREYNATINLYWDYARDKTRGISFNVKRDNYALGKSIFYIETSNNPILKLARFEIDRQRSVQLTEINVAVIYELQSGPKNRLDFNGKMNSDLRESNFQLELKLQRPRFNIYYSNEFDKNNGRLNKLHLRVAELLSFKVDKESDPNERQISLEFYNRDGSKYLFVSAATRDSSRPNLYIVNSRVLQDGKVLSSINSVFDNSYARLKVDVDASVTGKKYSLDVGIYNESLANGLLTKNGATVGFITAQVVPAFVSGNVRLYDLVARLQWNRFWAEFQEDLLGGTPIDKPKSAPGYQFNSYFGDVYGELVSDLKPVFDFIKEQRAAVRGDILRSVGIQLSIYAAIIPPLQPVYERFQQSAQAANKMAPQADQPLYIRLFKRYNEIADKLNDCVVKVSNSRFRRFAKYIPKLIRISYNDELTKEAQQFENRLTLKKKLLRASNLYQFNAEYRNRIRRIGGLILRLKSLRTRSLGAHGIRALINKYKYRSIKSDYTIVGTVFNRRVLIGFDGDSTVVQSKARYLLAHETHKNRFSIILNYNDDPNALAVYLYGQGPIGIAHNRASLNNENIALPRQINLANGKYIYIGRVNNGVCVHIDNEVKACCFEDSNSCSVAFTRWFTGKVNGLFGKTDNVPETLSAESWALDKVPPSVGLLRPSEEARRKCYLTFGRHRKSPLRDAQLAVNPDGWRTVCTSIVSNNPGQYCNFVKAYVEHAKFEKVIVKAPESCYQCNNQFNGKSYAVGARIAAADGTESDVQPGTDFVFLSLGCDSSKFRPDWRILLQATQKDAKRSTNYYAIKVDKEEVSVYQAKNGDFVNFDLAEATATLKGDAKSEIHEHAFLEALFYARTLFARRLASARHLIILSCGNCLPYRARTVRKLAKQLESQNIIVSSWGDYNFKTFDEESDETPFGYNESDLYLVNPSNQVSTDFKSSYRFEHEGDVCHRLAVRTHGTVFDVKKLQTPSIFSNIAGWLRAIESSHTFQVKTCEYVTDKKYGSYVDFKFGRIRHEENPDDDDNDDNAED